MRQTHRAVDADFVELRYPQYKGSIKWPGNVPSMTYLPIWWNVLDIFDELHKAGELIK